MYHDEVLFTFSGKDIVPYLGQLMEHLLTVLSTASTVRSKELAISAIGATGKGPLLREASCQTLVWFQIFLRIKETGKKLIKCSQNMDNISIVSKDKVDSGKPRGDPR